MTKQSQREDLDHKPEQARKVGEANKQLNQQGEAPRPANKNDPGKGPAPTQ